MEGHESGAMREDVGGPGKAAQRPRIVFLKRYQLSELDLVRIKSSRAWRGDARMRLGAKRVLVRPRHAKIPRGYCFAKPRYELFTAVPIGMLVLRFQKR